VRSLKELLLFPRGVGYKEQGNRLSLIENNNDLSFHGESEKKGRLRIGQTTYPRRGGEARGFGLVQRKFWKEVWGVQFVQAVPFRNAVWGAWLNCRIQNPREGLADLTFWVKEAKVPGEVPKERNEKEPVGATDVKGVEVGITLLRESGAFNQR